MRRYMVFGADIRYDDIHGKADRNNSMAFNNMVLGIDEYLDDNRKNRDIASIAFKKVYQRIFKQNTMKENQSGIRQDFNYQ